MSRDTFIQWALLLSSGIAIFMTQCNEDTQRYACFVGIAGQPFWFYETYRKKQWGIFVLTAWYTITWLQGFWRYWL